MAVSLLAIGVLSATMLLPQAEDDPICDWGIIAKFESCLKENFMGLDLASISSYLVANDFVEALPTESEDFFYFQRRSNTLSNYNASVVVWVSSTGSIDRIEVN